MVVQSLLSLIGGIVGAIVSAIFYYYYIEVGRKRKIETYWRIEREYKSEEEQKMTKLALHIGDYISNERKLLEINITKEEANDKLVTYYISNFETGSDEKKKEMAFLIRTRLRFYHLCGVLLKKKMVDKDLLFSLIGLAFQICQKDLLIILAARRKYYDTPHLYNHFEYLWTQYEKWKDGLSQMT